MTLKRSACSNPSALVRSAGRGGHPPALFTRMSMRPNSVDRRGHEVLELVALEHVGRDDERPPPGRPHPLGGGLEVGHGARRAHHVGPGLGERHRGAGTDALARAGHDGHAVGQLELVEDHGRTVGVRTPFVGRARRVARGVARVGCSGWVYRDWRGIVYPERPPAAGVVRALRHALRHRRDQQHLLPPAPAVDRRGVGRAGPAGVRVRAEGRSVRVAPHEAARRRALAPQPPRPGGAARPAPRPQPPPAPAPLEAERRAARRVPHRRTRAPPRGRSSCGSRRGCTTTCSRCSSATAPRCASTTCWPTTRGSGPPTGPTCASTGPNALEEKYQGRYGGRRLWRVGRPAGDVARRGLRRLRLLQQRLRGPRGRRCPMARGPAHAGAGATSWFASTR